jgi:eukaryotic-like serine/threonine-protein kinase
MNAQLEDLAAPPHLPSDAELVIPRGADPESAIVGPIAGRYDLGERIARGGMGIVYRAHDRLLNRTVAVKVMRGKYMDRPDLLRRFMAEARINGKLQHPGVVPVYDIGTLTDARPFIAMKLIEGKTFSRILRERAGPADNQAHWLKVFEALCQTMAYAHQQGVIHRDLKPDNVMVGAFGEVQVMDWGLAKFLDPADAVAPTPDGFEAIEKSAYLSADGTNNTPTGEHPTQATAVVPVGPDTPGMGHTTAGEVFGTLAYMPPEQARGEMDRVDRRGDVFSLGAILCQILTGQPPYYGPTETLREMARDGRLFGANILLDRCGADQALVILAKHCLGTEPESRPADAGVLTGLVTECLEGLQDRNRQIETTRLKAEARVAEAEARERIARQARRLSRLLAVAGVVVAAMLAAGLGWYANDRLSRENNEARRRTVALQQIEDSLVEAETMDAQAHSASGGALARDAAARQALAAFQRADALLSATANPPEELVTRLNQIKSRVDDSERDMRITLAMDQWRVDLFNSNGEFDRDGAAERCRKTMAAIGFDVLDRQHPLNLTAELNSHAAGTRVRTALVDWLYLTRSPSQVHVLSGMLKAADIEADLALVQATLFNDADAVARLVASTNDSVPAVGVAVAAQILIQAERSIEAEKLLLRGTRLHPNDFNLNAQLGLLLRSRKANDESLPYLTAARVARPDSAFINLEYGMALADVGRSDEALEILRGAVKSDPKSAAAHVRLGELLAARGDAEGSRKSYAAAVAVEPTNVAAELGLGQAELARGELDAAAKAFQSANAGKPNAVASAGIGRVHLKKWEPSKAAAAFRAAIELSPTNLDYRIGLVDALKMANDPAGAIREAQATTKAIPNSAVGHRLLGELLRGSGDRPGAIAAFRAAVKCDPADVDCFLQLGALCESTDDLAGATEAYRAAADLKPMDAKIQSALARVIGKSNDAANTVEACRRILAMEPGNVSVRQKLGRLLAERGDEAAIEELKKAADANQTSAEIRHDLADALLQFGQFRAAASAYREAADRFPEESAKQSAARTAARNATRWAGLEARLAEVLAGAVTPSTPSAWADFGEVCRHTGRYAAAAKFFAAATEGDEKHARPAAICAALAGFNRGIDAKELSDAQRAALRTKALAAFHRSPAWTTDPALAALKQPAIIQSLPAEERSDWQLVFASERAGR